MRNQVNWFLVYCPVFLPTSYMRESHIHIGEKQGQQETNWLPCDVYMSVICPRLVHTHTHRCIHWLYLVWEEDSVFWQDLKYIDNHKVVTFLIFWSTSILFSIMAVPIYIPSKCTRVLSSPHPPHHILFCVCVCVCVCFNNSHPDRHEMISYSDTDLHPPDD